MEPEVAGAVPVEVVVDTGFELAVDQFFGSTGGVYG
jgi:hypothetical protein